MAIRILWDLEEAVILLHALLRVLDGEIQRKDAVPAVSAVLRQRALNKGMEIDNVFRNINGITMQMADMELVWTQGKNGFKRTSMNSRAYPQMFVKAVNLYHDDKLEFERILNDAMGKKEEYLKEEYCKWLIETLPVFKFTRESLEKSYLITSMYILEEYCLKHKVINKKIFEITDFVTLKKVNNIIRDDVIFRFKHKGSLISIENACKFYLKFFSNNPVVIRNYKEQCVQGENVEHKVYDNVIKKTEKGEIQHSVNPNYSKKVDYIALSNKNRIGFRNWLQKQISSVPQRNILMYALQLCSNDLERNGLVKYSIFAETNISVLNNLKVAYFTFTTKKRLGEGYDSYLKAFNKFCDYIASLTEKKGEPTVNQNVRNQNIATLA